MRTTKRSSGIACAALLLAGANTPQALAQPAPDVPARDWYPEGYHDLRIAAAQQVATFPEELFSYDLYSCTLGDDLPEDMNEGDRELALVALEISQFRSDFADIGYPLEVYDLPLLEYERWLLTGDVPPWGRRAAEVESEPVPETEEYSDVDWTPEQIAEFELREYGMLSALKDVLEERRKQISPRKPRFFVEGGCGAGEEEFEIKLEPANGELWLINAFAFRVCERKVADPWDHRACGWTQYLNDDSAFASGRYMYEARWGSTVKRGARVLQYDYDEDEGGVITFRRN